MTRVRNAAATVLLLGALSLARLAHADPCRLDISGNDQMQYDKATLTVPGSCKEVTLTLQDRKSTRLNSSHLKLSRMPSSA